MSVATAPGLRLVAACCNPCNEVQLYSGHFIKYPSHASFSIATTGQHVAEAAKLEGKQPPVLYSLARDGALHSYVFLRDAPDTAAAAASPADEEASAGGDLAATRGRPGGGTAIAAAQPAFTGVRLRWCARCACPCKASSTFSIEEPAG